MRNGFIFSLRNAVQNLWLKDKYNQTHENWDGRNSPVNNYA